MGVVVKMMDRYSNRCSSRGGSRGGSRCSSRRCGSGGNNVSVGRRL